MATLTLKLPEMVDLALGHPEVGAVNFNVLHALLHVLINQTDQINTQVEFKADDAERIKSLQSSKTPATSIVLGNYGIQGNKIGAKEGDARVSVRPGDKFDNLDSKVDNLQKKVDEMLNIASNESLLNDEGMKQNVTNMWNLLSLHKRIEASEQGIQKVLSMIDDLSKKSGRGTGRTSSVNSPTQLQTKEKQPPGEKDDTSHLEEENKEEDTPSRISAPIESTTGEDFDEEAVMVSLKIVNKHIDALEEKFKHLEQRISNITGENQNEEEQEVHHDDKDIRDSFQQDEEKHESHRDFLSTSLSAGAFTKSPSLIQLKKDVDILKTEVAKIKRGGTGGGPAGGTAGGNVNSSGHGSISGKSIDAASKTSTASKLETTDSTSVISEVDVTKLNDQFKQLDRMFHNQMDFFQSHISEIERDLGALHEKVNTNQTGSPSDDVSDIGGLPEIYNKLNALQQELDNITTITGALQEDKDEREAKVESLLQSIEFLKTIKADKEDLEDALADKADQQTVNRKVSHDQFDAACDDLTRSLEDALAKLTQQEAEWKTVLDSIQVDIGNKLDKNEIHPLRDFVNTKLQSIQDRLRQLIKMKEDTEAAGTKSKLLKDVNCISCDKKVVMRRDENHPPIHTHAPLPPNRSMRPYLTYELDAVRKQTKKLPQGRNINDFESVVKEDEKFRTTEQEPISVMDHLCNRYCGGSHTMTTPHQRVTHLGHFLQQWGPEAVPLKEGYSRGTDGKMYKIREGKSDNVEKKTEEFSEAEGSERVSSQKSTASKQKVAHRSSTKSSAK